MSFIKENIEKVLMFILTPFVIFSPEGIGIIIAYILVGSAALIILAFGVIKIIANKSNAKKTLYKIGGLAIIALISYLMASGEVLDSFEKYEITSLTSKQVGMGLYIFYIVLGGAILAMAISPLLAQLKIKDKNAS